MSNAENPKKGADFQEQVQKWFQEQYGLPFESEVKIPIGNPPKDHKFDIVCRAKKIAIECKRYTWTESGNVPSAKMGFLNEAILYLSLLPEEYEKYIVMYSSRHEKKNESLAEYFYRMHYHLLQGVKVAEYNPEEREFRVIREWE